MNDDLEAIRMLTHRYAIAADRSQFGELADLWVEGGTFEVLADANGVRCAGREEIHAYFTSLLTAISKMSHHISNHVINVDGDGANGICYFLALTRTTNDVEFYAVGVYEDTYQRIGGTWKFVTREIRPFGSSLSLDDLRAL